MDWLDQPTADETDPLVIRLRKFASTYLRNHAEDRSGIELYKIAWDGDVDDPQYTVAYVRDDAPCEINEHSLACEAEAELQRCDSELTKRVTFVGEYIT